MNCIVNISAFIKESVQGTGNSDSTCLYLAIAKPNMTIKAKKGSIIQSYLALICKAKIPYLPPFYLNRKFLVTIFLVPNNSIQFDIWSALCDRIYSYNRFRIMNS